MSLLDDVLAANSAVLERADVPVPALAEGRRVVIVTCSEIRMPGGRDLATYFGFTHDEAFVIANADARVDSPAGDVARSVVTALALGEGGEVFVVVHEGCEFLESDPESAAALTDASTSTLLTAAEALCGQSFISARKLAMSSAETLRASPFLAGTPVHAMAFDESRCRLTTEQQGYGVAASAASAARFASGMSAAPSPILSAPGTASFGGTGPVSLFGSGPSSLMSAPSPDMGARAPASFLAPPAFVPPVAPPPAPLAPSTAFTMPSPSPPEPPAPSPIESLQFKDIPPPPPPRVPPKPAPAKPSDTDDPFRRAAETLERLRRERRK